jgi:hypothetical protein
MRIICAASFESSIKIASNFVAPPSQRTVVCVSPVELVRQQSPVFRVHDEEQTVQQYETLLTAHFQIARRVKFVFRSGKQSFDAQTQRFKGAIFQPFADAEAILGASFNRSLKQCFTPVYFPECGGAEKQIETEKLITESELFRETRR